MAPATRANSQGAPPTRMRQPSNQPRPEGESVVSSPLTEEPQTPTLDALSTLDERIQAAERRRDELQKLQRLRELEAEILQLEDKERSVSPDTTGNTEEEGPEGLRDVHKRGASRTLTPPPPKRMLKPKDPAEYKGKNLKEHREFFRSCEGAFLLLPQTFCYDEDKVLWAMQYLAGDPRELWYTHFERTFRATDTTTTWAYFKAYMLDLLSDPINRTLEAATTHAQAMQRKDQTVRSFATYLEVLEDQLTPYTEQQRVQHLFSKLRPEIQRAITNYHQVPATREDLIALGSTLERNLRRSSPTHDHPARPKASTKHPDRKSGDKLPPPVNKPARDKNSVTCFKCQKVGHYANECRSSNPNQIPVRINQTGKAQASPTSRGQ